MLQRAQTESLCYKEHKLKVYATKSTNWKFMLQRAQTGSLCYKEHKLEVYATKMFTYLWASQ